MTQVKQCVSRNKIQPEIVVPQLTKCGEIHINDDSTDAFLFCSFCTDDEDVKFLKTLNEFIDHIKWHRSDDFSCPKDESVSFFEVVELEVASDLCERPIREEPNPKVNRSKEEGDDEPFNIDGDALINILDLYKKCPCLWHKESATREKDIVEAAYNMLTTLYNKCTKQNKSVEFVMDFIERIRKTFLDEFMGEDTTSDASHSSPWYFPHLVFLLMSDETALDESIYTDFECTICTQEMGSQEDLWDHLYQCHLELGEENFSSIGFDDEDDAKSNDSRESEEEDSRELLERFIEAYENQPRLWNKQNKGYYKRKLRNESYSVLLAILQEHDPAATRYDVIERIKCLRTKFAYERRKIEQSKLCGGEYEPLIWYYKKLLFLINEVKTKPIESNQPIPEELLQPVVSKKNLVSDMTCSVCFKAFTNKTAWLDHMQCSHDKKAFQSTDGFFYCPICNVQNKTKNALIRHLRHSHSTDLRTCQDCGTKFRFLSALAKHRAKVHKDFHPFKCDQCGKGFVNLCRMKAHAIIHWDVNDRPYACEHCGAKFSNKTNLKVHIRRHTKDFYLRCEICAHMAATSTELRFHKFTHTKEYPCICDICGKGFRSNALLATHQNECHGDKMFKCEVCEKQFKSLKKLEYHFEGHKPVADQVCETCGKKFFRSSALRKHIRLKHKETLEDVVLFDDLIDDRECSEMDDDEIEQLEDIN